MKCFFLALVFSLGCFFPQAFSQPALQDPTNISENETRVILGSYLLIVCGFCWLLLLFLWRSSKEKGVLWLSSALLCWAFSGLVLLLSAPDENLEKIGIPTLSTLNSICLLLMISHLDKEDLPSFVRRRISLDFLNSGIFVVLGFYALSFLFKKWDVPMLVDFTVTLITLVLLLFSFVYLLTKRVSLPVAVLSGIALAITLVVHIFRFAGEKINLSEFAGLETILKFSYTPLLIITFFVLIISWLWKKLKTKDAMQEEEREKMRIIHEGEIASSQAQWEKEKQAIEKRHKAESASREKAWASQNQGFLEEHKKAIAAMEKEIAALRQSHETAFEMSPEIEQNRRKLYPKFDERDWKIIEYLAKGKKAPEIEALLGFEHGGSVASRIDTISNKWDCKGKGAVQFNIVRFALQKGLLTLGHLGDGGARFGK